MIDDNIKRKVNKKRKKKHNEMYLDDYAKKNNIDININFKYEDEIEYEIKNFEYNNNPNFQYDNTQNVETPKNKTKIPKDENKDSRKESENEEYNYNSNTSGNVYSQKQASFSTINSSIDDDKNNNNINTSNNNNISNNINNNDINNSNIKKSSNFINNNLSEKEKKIAEIIKNKINDSYEEGIRNKIASAIKNLKIKEYKMNNNNNKIFPSNNNFNSNINLNYSLNNNYNRILINKNNNFNYFNFYNIQNKNINYINYLLYSNYNNYKKNLLLNKNNLNIILEQISILEKKDVNEIYLANQLSIIFAYIKSKTKELDTNKKNDEKEGPEHPYFYINHLEEIQIKNVLFLIEGIFLEENLKKDFNLLKILNRDGYASLKQLEKHPLIIKCNNITEEHLKTVFSEHRENEVTETVETFDDILIRNRKWRNIRKEIGDINDIEKLCMDDMEKIRKDQLDNLLEKKIKILENNKNIFLQYKINNYNLQQQLMKLLQFNYNYNYNYNICYNNFNNLYNNNVYNNNLYNSNVYNFNHY